MVEMKFHIVFVTKYRYKYINNKIEKFLYYIIRKQEVRYNFKILEMNVGGKNHIHLVIDYKGSLSIQNLCSTLKRITTYNLNKNFNFKNKKFWNDSYYVSSVSNISKEVIYNYVRNQ